MLSFRALHDTETQRAREVRVACIFILDTAFFTILRAPFLTPSTDTQRRTEPERHRGEKGEKESSGAGVEKHAVLLYLI